jgi:maleylacetoacetate isomerase/maleylpyruvate isomerase
MLKLYSYFRSSASFRLRIALALKGLAYETAPVHLLKDGGEQHLPGFRAVNPAGLVPVLQDGDQVLTQSVAIMEYLDEAYPARPLLPQDVPGRARVRALALTIACDVHPLGNLRVLNYVGDTLGAGEQGRKEWASHWIALGFAAFEDMLAQGGTPAGAFCHGDTPGMADCCLVPQVFNARRFGLDLAPYPHIQRITALCESLPAFAAAHPAQQPDAPR